MARIYTLGELVTLAKQYSDMENSSHISDVEWRGYVSSGYSVLYSVLVESGMRYFEKTDTYTKGTDDWRLPADFLSCIGVDYLQDGTLTGTRWALQMAMVQERNFYSGVSGTGYAAQYAITGQTIGLAPIPATGQKYALVYVPQPAKLTDDSVELDVVTPDGEQFIIWYSVFMARDKEESDVRSALRERMEALERLREWANTRAMNAPRRTMTDGDMLMDDDPGGYRWTRGA